MTRQDVRNRIVQNLADHYGHSPVLLSDNTAIDNLGMDSLDRVDFIAEIEDEYGITVPDEECYEAKTVGEIVDIVYALVKDAEKYMERR